MATRADLAPDGQPFLRAIDAAASARGLAIEEGARIALAGALMFAARVVVRGRDPAAFLAVAADIASVHGLDLADVLGMGVA